MREITYIIDDKKGFERILKKEDLLFQRLRL